LELIRFAPTAKLKRAPRRAADEEGVAQDAFWSFYRSYKASRLPRLENRHDLLALLTIITARKAASLIERETRLKRGGGKVQGESGLAMLVGSLTDLPGIAQIPVSDLKPEEEAEARDTYQYFRTPCLSPCDRSRNCGWPDHHTARSPTNSAVRSEQWIARC
jgi:DNA-directed RNA polymerase specialized sigma24 family protein